MNEIKILLVDDEEDFIKALAERLAIRDLPANAVFNGLQAMHEISESEPDIMILDLKMPGIDGMEVLRRVRSSYPDIQVIIQTGHGCAQDEAEARRMGIFDYLKKPVDIEVLLASIKAAAMIRRNKERIAPTDIAGRVLAGGGIG